MPDAPFDVAHRAGFTVLAVGAQSPVLVGAFLSVGTYSGSDFEGNARHENVRVELLAVEYGLVGGATVHAPGTVITCPTKVAMSPRHGILSPVALLGTLGSKGLDSRYQEKERRVVFNNTALVQ